MNTNVKSKVRYSKLIGCILICFVVSTRWSETSIAATRYSGGGGGSKIPSTKSRRGWTEHGVFGDRTRCFSGWFDGCRDSRARAVSMDAETRWRMPCTLPSLKNTSWPDGEPPSDVTTHVRAHRVHDPFRPLPSCVSSVFLSSSSPPSPPPTPPPPMPPNQLRLRLRLRTHPSVPSFLSSTILFNALES